MCRLQGRIQHRRRVLGRDGHVLVAHRWCGSSLVGAGVGWRGQSSVVVAVLRNRRPQGRRVRRPSAGADRRRLHRVSWPEAASSATAVAGMMTTTATTMATTTTKENATEATAATSTASLPRSRTTRSRPGCTPAVRIVAGRSECWSAWLIWRHCHGTCPRREQQRVTGAGATAAGGTNEW